VLHLRRRRSTDDVADGLCNHVLPLTHGDDLVQPRRPQIGPILGQQSGRGPPAAPIAAVAGYLQHRGAWGDLAERDDAGSEGFGLALD